MTIYPPKSIRLLLCSIIALIVSLSAKPEGFCLPEAVIVSDSAAEHPLGRHIETLEDRNGAYSIDEVSSGPLSERFVPNRKQIPNFGFTSSTYWVRLRLKNGSPDKINRLLEVGFPLLDKITLYAREREDRTGHPGQWRIYQAGRAIPFNQREIKHRNFIFNLNLPADREVECYMRIQTEDGMIFPLSVWDPESYKIEAQRGQFVFGIYYGIVIVMVFYNLFLFVSIRDRSYIYYILYIASFGFFQLAMNGLAYQHLWPGSPWWATHANPFFIGLSIFFAVKFSMEFLDTKRITPTADRIFLVLMLFSGLLAAASFFVSYSITIVAGQILPLMCILLVLPTSIYHLAKGNRSARFYIIAWTAFLIGVVLSTLRVMGVLSHNFLTEHGLQLGSAIEMVLLSFALADRINIMKVEKEEAQSLAIETQKREFLSLKKAKEEMEEAHKRISLSEERYRLLIEGTGDIIFTLDGECRFISINRAITHHLKVRPEQLLGTSFFDLVYHHNYASMARQVVHEKIEQLMTTKQPVEFRAEFKSELVIEPYEMLVRLEYLTIEGKTEILGKATSVMNDEMVKYLISENQRYEVGNHLLTAEEITHRLTQSLKKHMNTKEINLIRLGLREIIINAIEHGNLNVSFKDKSEAMNEDSYFEFLRNRQHDARYSSKKVSIDYSLNDDEVEYVIADEGEGFDHENFRRAGSDTADSQMLQHGRGITMTCNIFDQVEFNGKGNVVRLVKKLRQ